MELEDKLLVFFISICSVFRIFLLPRRIRIRQRHTETENRLLLWNI